MNKQDTPINILATKLHELTQHAEHKDDDVQDRLIDLVKAATYYSDHKYRSKHLTEQSKGIFDRFQNRYIDKQEEGYFEPNWMIDELMLAQGRLIIDIIDTASNADEVWISGAMIKPYADLIRTYKKWREGLDGDFILELGEAWDLKFQSFTGKRNSDVTLLVNGEPPSDVTKLSKESVSEVRKYLDNYDIELHGDKQHE